MFLVLAVIFSVCAVSASDVNVTDSYATSLVDDTSDVSVPMENTADSSEISVSSYSNVDNDSSKVSLSSEEVLGSENSNTLSTNTNSNSLLSSVSKIDVSDSVISKPVTKYYKGSTKYTATFLDGQGKVLNNAKVKVTVDGKIYTKQINNDGTASFRTYAYDKNDNPYANS